MENATKPSLSKRYAKAIMRQVENTPKHGYDSLKLPALFLFTAILFWVAGTGQENPAVSILFKIGAILNLLSASWRFIISGFIQLIESDYEKKSASKTDETE